MVLLCISISEDGFKRRVITEDVKLLFFAARSREGGIPYPITGTTYYHAQLGFPDKVRTTKELVVCRMLFILFYCTFVVLCVFMNTQVTNSLQ